ncbi:hypothetical protein RHGRI_006406 [Rhododendron griersonianum]|uniref:F-box protein n=1 Tax=Rhododendron griersonianum TaxID=479676 RepID=A0AAV6KU15_9ERIC|nr:hypothetical protein RHGRI_006406 [Rhododendron griersonianum]
MLMKRDFVGSSSSSSWKRTRFDFDDSEVYLLYDLHGGPVRIYLLGGDVGLHGEVDFVLQEGRNTESMSKNVYFFDTAAAISSSSSSLSVAPPMEGGKTLPRAIHVNGMVYVISAFPSFYTSYSEEEPLFEVFDPLGNEGEGKWSSLPRPPFYCRSSNHGSHEINGAGRIVSHAVVGHKILFFTTKRDPVNVFDVCYHRWTSLKVYNGGNHRLPFRRTVMPIFDSVWAALGTSPCRMSPISTFNLTADFGLVGREVEGLETIRSTHEPPLAYGIYYHLLDMGNGLVCLLKFGNDEEGFMKGKAYVSATVFRLVKKRTDKVSFGESKYRLGQRLLPLLPPGVRVHDYSEVIGEIQVFCAEGLRNSLFAPGVENYNTTYAAVGSFVM